MGHQIAQYPIDKRLPTRTRTEIKALGGPRSFHLNYEELQLVHVNA